RDGAANAVADNVDRPGDRETGDRRATRQRLDYDIAERVGAAREDEDVGRGIDAGELVVRPVAEEMGVRISRLQPGEFRPLADDHLAAGQVEIEEGRQVFFHGDAADAEEDRPREIELATLVLIEVLDVDAARP